MSKHIATRAIRGANAIVAEAEALLDGAVAEKGADTPVEFPNTAYYLPVIYGMLDHEVETLADLKPVLGHAKNLLHPVPDESLWVPYLGETLDSGQATLLAAEAIEGVRFALGQQPEPYPGLRLAGSTDYPEFVSQGGDGHLNGPIDDIQLRSWGIQLVDGRMPGFAAIVGKARSNEAAVAIVRELQQRNILTFLSGNVNGRSIIDQLQEEGVEMGYDTYIVPFGRDTISAIYALGFATRSALTFGGMSAGDWRRILLYNKYRVFAFVLALGEVDDLKYAAAAGAISYGFPTIADTVIPEIRPTGITQYEHVLSMPWNEIEAENEKERAAKLVQKAIEVRGVKIRITEVPVPVAYGSAFEGEVVRRADMRIEFGGKYSRAFEYLTMRPMDEVEDGKIEVIGPDQTEEGKRSGSGFEDVEEGGAIDIGFVVEVAGREMEKDFEPVLERQIHDFTNAASGIQHIGQRDIAWIRISKKAAEKGFGLEHFGKMYHARFHADFGNILDKVQVTVITDPDLHAEWLEKAREAYEFRNKRLADMTDEAVDTFYDCTLCVPEGEEIVLPDGSFMPVDRLVDDYIEEGRGFDVLTFDATQTESRPVNEVFINRAPKKLIKVTLDNGNTLMLTANHEVLTDRPEGLTWLPAGKLVTGDYVISNKQTKLDGYQGSGDDYYIIDYLPDDYEISDDEFYADLREPLARRYGSLAEAARQLDLNYAALCGALRRDSHRCLTMGETKKIVASLGFDWDELKEQIHGFKPACKLLETRLSADVMYLAGLVASDGCVSWREDRNTAQVQFTNTEPALIDRFCEIHRRLLGTGPQVYDWTAPPDAEIKPDRPVRVCYTYNPILYRLLAGLGVSEVESDASWRGEGISTLPSRLVAAFLRGLFDGDGDVSVSGSGPRFAFTTQHHREARHIHLLLKKLGIDSTITHRSTPSPVYRVRTRGKQAFASFRALVGSEHPDKQARMGTEISLDRAGRRHDIVPLGCGKLLRDLYERWSDEIQVTKLSVDYKTWRTWLEGQRRPSKKALARLLEGLVDVVDVNDHIYRELVSWSRSNVSLERVKTVEKVKAPGEKVYNLGVSGTHNYLINGVCLHNCQSFAPTHVCVVTPERLGLCGAYSWLDCRASYHINPTGPNQPIPKGERLDPELGYWTGTQETARSNSQGTVENVALYSMMENPMTSCGCFECIMVYVPEVEGVIVISREDPDMTPAGMKFSTLAGMAGGGIQTPGVMGVGKYYLTSPKFIKADGGFKRIVWVSKFIKDTMMDELQAVAEREGIPDLIDRIADGSTVSTVDELVEWVHEKNHPVLEMGPMHPRERGVGVPPEEIEGVEVEAEAEAEAEVEEVPEPEEVAPEEAAPVPEAEVEAEVEPEVAAEPEEVVPEPAPEEAPRAPAPPEREAEVPVSAKAPKGADMQRLAEMTADIVIDRFRSAMIAALRELGGEVQVPTAPREPAPPAPKVEEPVAPEPEVKEEIPAAVKPARPQVPPWSEDKETEIAIPKEQWTGRVREITLGATEADGGTRRQTITVGGQTTLSFLGFEGDVGHRPAVAVEIQDRRPDDWSALLMEAWGDAMDDPGEWARAAEEAGADLIALQLSLKDADGNSNSPEKARATVRKVLKATGLPLIVLGPGQVEADNELLVAVAEETSGERVVLGMCEEKNYRTIVAAALAHDQLVISSTPMDVNLSKQLVILIADMGLSLDQILMDPTCAGVGYGLEYGYSVMERLRLAALKGDKMTQLPMIVTAGAEAWRQKEAKVGDDVPEAWGDWEERAINWETVTAAALVESAADIVVMRHPESIRRIHAMIEELMGEK